MSLASDLFRSSVSSSSTSVIIRPVSQGNIEQGICIAQINIHSLLTNVDQLSFLVCKYALNVLCITEGMLDDSITES